jgi:exosortase
MLTADSNPPDRVSTEPGAVPSGRWLALGTLLLTMALLYAVWPYQHWIFEQRTSVLSGWLRLVWADSEWQFCLLVPGLVGYLLYRQRAALRTLPLAGTWWGLVPVGLGLVFFWMGYKVDTGYLGFLSAHLTLGGLILLLGGWPWGRALLFPWLFLAFMWPMFPLEERLAFPLRMWTAGASGSFLNLLGLAVVREGTALYSAADPATGLAAGDLFRLDVEEPCSGIRSLFSLMMVSALYGYLTLKSPAQRLLLFLAAIPLAMVGNFVRMIMLAVAARWFGSDFAVGRNIEGHQEMSFFHSMAGFAVFAVALAGLFAVCSVLERKHWRKIGGRVASPPPFSPRARAGGAPWQLALAAMLSTALALGVCARTDASLTLAEPGVLLDLPLQTHGYQGQPMDMTAQEQNVLDEGVRLARSFYTSEMGRRVLVTVIVGGPGKRTLHRPEVCLPGQGWTIASSLVLPLSFADGRATEATLLRLFREVEVEPGKRVRMRALNLYWYVGSDGTTRPDYYGHISKGYQDAIFRNLNHRWSMVSTFVPVSEALVGQEDGLLEFGVLEDVRSFLSHLVPQVMPPETLQNE